MSEPRDLASCQESDRAPWTPLWPRTPAAFFHLRFTIYDLLEPANDVTFLVRENPRENFSVFSISFRRHRHTGIHTSHLSYARYRLSLRKRSG